MKKHCLRVTKYYVPEGATEIVRIDAINPDGKVLYIEARDDKIKEAAEELKKELDYGFMAPDLVDGSYYIDPGVI